MKEDSNSSKEATKKTIIDHLKKEGKKVGVEYNEEDQQRVETKLNEILQDDDRSNVNTGIKHIIEEELAIINSKKAKVKEESIDENVVKDTSKDKGKYDFDLIYTPDYKYMSEAIENQKRKKQEKDEVEKRIKGRQIHKKKSWIDYIFPSNNKNKSNSKKKRNIKRPSGKNKSRRNNAFLASLIVTAGTVAGTSMAVANANTKEEKVPFSQEKIEQIENQKSMQDAIVNQIKIDYDALINSEEMKYAEVQDIAEDVKNEMNTILETMINENKNSRNYESITGYGETEYREEKDVYLKLDDEKYQKTASGDKSIDKNIASVIKTQINLDNISSEKEDDAVKHKKKNIKDIKEAINKLENLKDKTQISVDKHGISAKTRTKEKDQEER